MSRGAVAEMNITYTLEADLSGRDVIRGSGPISLTPGGTVLRVMSDVAGATVPADIDSRLEQSAGVCPCDGGRGRVLVCRHAADPVESNSKARFFGCDWSEAWLLGRRLTGHHARKTYHPHGCECLAHGFKE